MGNRRGFWFYKTRDCLLWHWVYKNLSPHLRRCIVKDVKNIISLQLAVFIRIKNKGDDRRRQSLIDRWIAKKHLIVNDIWYNYKPDFMPYAVHHFLPESCKVLIIYSRSKYKFRRQFRNLPSFPDNAKLKIIERVTDLDALDGYDFVFSFGFDCSQCKVVGKSISFFVGTVGGEAVCAEADLNGDGRVNITDFSILLYHWGTDNECADQNQNGVVDLIDFSVMMYYWTG